jgi:very-short-patch-repair endonuclease
MRLSQDKKLHRLSLVRSRELRKRSTEAERVLWAALRRKHLTGAKFHRQYSIYYEFEGGESFFVADFYCHSVRLVVEVDGGIHDARRDYDEHRTRLLKALGLKVIRFKNEQVLTDLNEVLKQLSAVCTLSSPSTGSGRTGTAVIRENRSVAYAKEARSK